MGIVRDSLREHRRLMLLIRQQQRIADGLRDNCESYGGSIVDVHNSRMADNQQSVLNNIDTVADIESSLIKLEEQRDQLYTFLKPICDSLTNTDQQAMVRIYYFQAIQKIEEAARLVYGTRAADNPKNQGFALLRRANQAMEEANNVTEVLNSDSK